jgi:2-polyprenyl-3-methyl-5-hydroxy-6-metoxy-1,4-benzoquinol methylase
VFNSKIYDRIVEFNKRSMLRRVSSYQISKHDYKNSIGSESFEYSGVDILAHLACSQKTAKRVVSLFSEYLGSRILEVGGGLGQISEVLIDSDIDLLTLEPDPHLFGKLEEKFHRLPRFKVQNLTVESLLVEGKFAAEFDSAIYINVLEHIADDNSELINVRKFLKTGGNVVVFSPALPILYGTMDGLSGHFRRYTKSELIGLVKDSGFEVVHVEYFDFVGIFPYFFMYRLLKVRTIGSGGMFVYDNIILPISTMLERLARGRLIGKNLLIVGRKIQDKSN